MADQNITALPVSTTPESSDQLLLVGATEEKLIDYDKLADAILNKLTSKNFSLDQGTMPLISALNQLNSKPPLVADIHNTDIELYLSKLGESYFAMLYFSYRNTNAPVVDGFKWEYFSAIIIKSRIIAFSPSGNPGAVITRQYIDGKLSNWTQIK